MRIGYEAKRLFLNDRGLGNYARNLLNGMINYYPDENYHLYSPKVSKEYIDSHFFSRKNVSIHKPEGPIQNLTKSAWRSLYLGKIAAKANLDIFHGLSQELPKDIKRSGAKSIVTIHDMIFLRHPEFYKPIDRSIYFNKVKFAVHNADCTIAISNQTKQDLIETFQLDESRISVIYQSCNEVFYSERTPKELAKVKNKWNLPKEFLLYVGALNENKNVLVILEALARLKGKFDLPLVIVGNGAGYKKVLKDFVSKNKLTNQVLFASELASPTPLELSAFYQMASIFIFPSFYEGFGIPILEARFSNTPVIASNTSCLEEAGENDSYYFNPSDADELSNLIIKCSNDNKQINVGEKFTLKGSTQFIYDTYKNIV